MAIAPVPPELSRVVPLARIRDGWTSETGGATADERAALARRFDLVELGALEAAVRLRRARAGRYVEIDGALKAAVVQSCVVTLDPVPAALDERFGLMLGPIGGADAPEGGELIVDLDEPEPLDGDAIDISELVAQQLSLALDPYPRSAGAADAVADAAAAGDRPAASPFAVLRGRGKPK